MSIQKMGYLPVPQIDFIFPVFVEEWGFVGAIALLATFGVLIWRGFHTARHAPDRFSALLSIGLTGMITLKPSSTSVPSLAYFRSRASRCRSSVTAAPR